MTYPYVRVLEPKGPELKLLKSVFYAENFVFRLCWSISNSMSKYASKPEIAKDLLKFSILGSLSFTVIDAGTAENCQPRFI